MSGFLGRIGFVISDAAHPITKFIFRTFEHPQTFQRSMYEPFERNEMEFDADIEVNDPPSSQLSPGNSCLFHCLISGNSSVQFQGMIRESRISIEPLNPFAALWPEELNKTRSLIHLNGIATSVITHVIEPENRIDNRWLTKEVIGVCLSFLADGILFQLPVIADALSESGCDDEGLLRVLWNESEWKIINSLTRCNPVSGEYCHSNPHDLARDFLAFCSQYGSMNRIAAA